mmetsp:Transcript_23766/g.57314  ORF Transcript_23766/g.57314 Transcript_23766/m.57314 type:complete len:134 (-) Transcript_23766:183-584(-)
MSPGRISYFKDDGRSYPKALQARDLSKSTAGIFPPKAKMALSILVLKPLGFRATSYPPPIKPRGYQFQLSHANGLSRSKAISCHILSWSEGAQAQGMRTILCQSARVPSKPRALRGKGSQATGPGPIQVTSPF